MAKEDWAMLAELLFDRQDIVEKRNEAIYALMLRLKPEIWVEPI